VTISDIMNVNITSKKALDQKYIQKYFFRYQKWFFFFFY